MTLTKILQECQVLSGTGKLARMTVDAWGKNLTLLLHQNQRSIRLTDLVCLSCWVTHKVDIQLYSFYVIDSILRHLTFPHTWVRLMASRLFGLLFSQRHPEDLIKLSKERDKEDYLAIDLPRKVFIFNLESI